MLLKSIEEVKDFVSVNISNSLDSIKGDIGYASGILRQLLGKEQYEALDVAYNADPETLSDSQKKVLPLCQAPLANLAYAEYVTIGQLDISDAGFRIIVDNNFKTAFQWQIDDVREYFRKKAYEQLDSLLEFLEENKADYPLWANSNAYTITKKYFINSATQFSEFYNIRSSRRTFLAMQATMQKVEDFHLLSALGTILFDQLKGQIKEGNLSEDNKKLFRYILPAVAHLTIAKAIGPLSLELSDSAIVVNEYKVGSGNNREKNTPEAGLLASVKQEAERDGYAYLKQLTDYLDLNASADKYAAYYTYKNPSTDPSAGPGLRSKVETTYRNNSSKRIYGGF